MEYSIIFSVVVGLLGNCLLTQFINTAHIFTGSQALPWERNVCGSPFECLGLALTVVLLFGNIRGQRNIRPTTTARITPTTLAPITTAPPTACPANYSLYDESCGRFCYRYEIYVCQDWSNAQAACKVEGGDLLAPDECNYEFFRERAIIGEKGMCGSFFWLGAQREPNGDNFRTVIGNQISNNATFWGIGRPDNFDGNEDCLEMSSKFRYKANDETCSDIQGYLCYKII